MNKVIEIENVDDFSNKEMTITQAIKKMVLLEKKIKRNAEKILKYSAKLSNQQYSFGSKEKHEEAIKGWVQSSEDMSQLYCDLHARINLTNIYNFVRFDQKNWRLNDLLLYRRKIAKLLSDNFSAMNAKSVERELKHDRNYNNSEIYVEKMYDENWKLEREQYYQDLSERIDSVLETVNAKTKLVELENLD